MYHQPEIEQLTRRNFEPFGDVIAMDEGAITETINSGWCEKFANLAIADCNGDNGKAAIHLYNATPLPQPIVIKSFERHPLGTQCFVPLGENPYLVVVAPPGRFDISAVRVFLARSHQGIQYRKGTWHHFCLALKGQSSFLVIDRVGPGSNCDEIQLSAKDRFQISADI